MTSRSVAIGGEPVRYGYTLADIDAIAKYATRINPWYRDMDVTSRYEAAYDAIVELLLTSEDAPQRYELKAAGRTACDHWARSHLAQDGWTRAYGRGTSHGFQRYWWQRDTPSFDERVVEELAVTQIWGTLTVTQQRALSTLAAAGDYTLTAESLGISYGTAKKHISDGRKCVRALWLEHETPRRMWGNDRRAGRKGDGGNANGLTGTRALALRTRLRSAREEAK
jgi:DNA-directed RNA polymerase specialized sigma24 family protein